MNIQKERDRRSRRRPVGVTAAVAGLAAAVLTGCGGTTATPRDPAPQPSAVPTSTPNADETPTDPTRNDLTTRRLERVLRTGDLTVNVLYRTTLPTARWTPTRPKPLSVSVSAINGAKQGQKIYLSKMTLFPGLSDDNGLLDAPRALSDVADVTPGFILNFPNSYDQNLLIPAVDDSATQLTMDINYELLIQVDAKSKDYAKRTVSDTVVVPLV